jgi:protease I
MNTGRILIITADDFEDTELLCPMNRLLEAGYAVDIASLQKSRITGKKGYTVEADLAVDELPAEPSRDYDLLLLPGGKAPAKLRENSKVQDAARNFDQAGKPIAAICHGPQILISAGLLKGKQATSYTSVASELKDAGALYEDAEVVVDGKYVFSRHPGDIPAFNREIMAQLA